MRQIWDRTVQGSAGKRLEFRTVVCRRVKERVPNSVETHFRLRIENNAAHFSLLDSLRAFSWQKSANQVALPIAYYLSVRELIASVKVLDFIRRLKRRKNDEIKETHHQTGIRVEPFRPG